jgi:sugar/nucleoside kinase (ribokinase family)
MFDFCVIGHVTRDYVRIGDRETVMPGGTAFYASMALSRMGARVAVVTKVAAGDESLLADLIGSGVHVVCRACEHTTVFDNIYAQSTSVRVQKIRSLADPFKVTDVAGLAARSFHLGPLTKHDIPLELIARLSGQAVLLLDVQGYLRGVDKGSVVPSDWEEKAKGLSLVNILKADESEARILSGKTDPKEAARKISSFGPDEVVITRGSQGGLIYDAGEFQTIRAVTPRTAVDATGCGDTFAAAYLFKRMASAGVREAGDFAAAMAALKLEHSGPLTEMGKGGEPVHPSFSTGE